MDPRPRDHTEAEQNIARDLAEIASAKGEASPWLSDENYDALRHRFENAHAAVRALGCKPGAGCGSKRRGVFC